MRSFSARMGLPADSAWLALLALLAITPVWLSTLPVGTDVPQHAAQIQLLLDHLSTHTWTSAGIYLDLFTPYLLTYFVGALLATLLGTLTSVKLLISLSLAGLLLATARLLKRWGGDSRLSLLAMVGLYGFSYQWGFLPFNLSLVFMLLLLAEMPPHSAPRTAAPQIVLWRCVGLALAIVLTHGLTALVTAAIVLTLAIIEPQAPQRVRHYVLTLLLVLPIAVWQALADTGVQGFGDGIYLGLDPLFSPYFYYQEIASTQPHLLNGWGRFTGFFPRIVGWSDGSYALALGIALLVMPWLFGYRLHANPSNLLVVLAILVILLLMPSVINGSLYSAERFSLLFFCVYPLMLSKPPKTSFSLWITLALIIGAVWLTHADNARRHDRSLSNLVSGLNTLPPNQRALSLTYTYQADGFIAPVYLHSGQWYGVLKNGLVDPNFAATDLQPLRYEKAQRPFATIGQGFDWNPRPFDWQQFQGDRYRVFMVRGSLSTLQQHTGCVPPNPIPSHSGEWLALYLPNTKSVGCGTLATTLGNAP